MKFGKQFEEYKARAAHLEVPHVPFKSLKKILKPCRLQHKKSTESTGVNWPKCENCEDSGELFLQKLTESIRTILSGFTHNAKGLLNLHLDPSLPLFSRFFCFIRGVRDATLLEKGTSLMDWAAMTHLAVRKLLKKFEKIHGSSVQQEMKGQLLGLQWQLAKSPYLAELAAMAALLASQKATRGSTAAQLEGSIEREERRALAAHILEDPCAICLEPLFRPAALACGHVFCHVCACGAARWPPAFGLRGAGRDARCPLCRQREVFQGARLLKEACLLMKHRNPSYWRARRREEKRESRVQQSQYWQREADRAQLYAAQRAALARANGTRNMEPVNLEEDGRGVETMAVETSDVNSS